jgi:hypothetical protein
MTDEVGDEAAIEFAASLYRAIASGVSMKKAFDLGVIQLRVLRIPEEHNPRLLVREGVNAEEVVLVNPT